MDVNNRTFHWQLPRILRSLSTAHFVSIDLELSGIPSKGASSRRPGLKGNQNRQTLQQRYNQAREAAERYQILQVGLTLVHEVKSHGKYIARPFNFFLNPVINEKLDIERVWSYQSGAVEFLLGHGFRMEAPYTDGVPYLSKEEHTYAIESEFARIDRDNIPDILLRDDQVEELKFVRKARADIEQWKSGNTKTAEYLNIAPATINNNTLAGYTDRGLNRYQKRLVHQLVRAEYPDLVAVSRGTFIQIIPFDKKREDAIKKARTKGSEERIARQAGLRWIVEAMTGGDLSAIDPMTFEPSSTEPRWLNVKEIQREWDETKDILRKKQTVLVGHNLFMDLINFYKCFFGKLPDRLEDFQAIIHRMFPLIIDTKYLATHNSPDPNSRSGLEELDLELNQQPVPIIDIHISHPKYLTANTFHEAGYDSFVAAKILTRLSAKLEASGYYVGSDDEVWLTPSEDSLGLEKLNLNPQLGSSKENGRLASAQKALETVSIALQQGLVTAFPTISQPATQDVSPKTTIPTQDDFWKETAPSSQEIKHAKKSKKSSDKPPVPSSPRKATSAFSHAGRFDLLLDLAADEDEVLVDVAADEVPPSDVNAQPMTGTEMWGEAEYLPPVSHYPPPQMGSDGLPGRPIAQWIPAWDSGFWDVYGNKLRVNGTVEGICILNCPRDGA